MPTKLTTEQFINKAIAIHGNKYDYTNTNYLGNAKKVEITCNTCKDVFTPLANDHVSKKVGCPSCAGVKRFTTESWVERAKTVHGDVYDYSKVKYVNSETVVEIICCVHGSFFQKGNAHLQGHKCDKCSGTFKLTTEEFVQRSIQRYGNKFDYNKTVYTDSKTPLVLTCKIHGDFQVTPVSHLNSATGYSEELANAPATLEHFIQRSTEVHGATYDYSKVVYTTNKTDVEIICSKHGSFFQSPHNHYKGARCEKCACGDTESKPEIVLKKALGFDIESHSMVTGREIDIYIPKHRVGIEVNGIYWHSDGVVKSNKQHLVKTELSKKFGIKLLHFTDAEIYNKLPIVVSMVNNACSMSKKIMARKCLVRQIDFKTYSEFFNSNHLSGNVSAKKCYGLFYNGSLVSAMSFGVPRFTDEYSWEILRFATTVGMIVVGGASKLFAAFKADVGDASVLSYADRRFGEGEVYKQLGFEFLRNTEIGYNWHHKDGSVVSRLQSQKHKLEKLLGAKHDPELTAVENMRRAGYFKLHDCGHAVYALTNTKTCVIGAIH